MSESHIGRLSGCHIDFPRQGNQVDASALDVVGWVIGKTSDAIAVEVRAEHELVRRMPLTVHRPDVGLAFAGVPAAAHSGFKTTLNLLRAKPAVLSLEAILKDGTRVPLSDLRCRYRWRTPSLAPAADQVSVIIPCHGEAPFVSDAIESVTAQTYPHIEMVVVDAGSNVNGPELAARYPGTRHISVEAEGLAEARNIGIQRSIGEYLVFLDPADRLLPHALELGREALRSHPEAAFVAGASEEVAADGASVSRSPEPDDTSNHYVSLVRRNCIPITAAVMYRRAVFERVRGFDTSVSPAADYELYLRIAKDFPIHCYSETVAQHRADGAAKGLQG